MTNEQIFEQGAEAFRDGKTVADCPYKNNATLERTNWLGGFKAESDASAEVAKACAL